MRAPSRRLTGAYFWLPLPGDVSVVWDVVACHHLGFDSETGHVEMWGDVIGRLATAWHKDVATISRALENCPYGLPRGRVTRAGRQFLILHGGDWPCAEGLDRVMNAFGLNCRPVRVVIDEHERMLDEDLTRVMDVLSIRVR